MTHLVSHTSLGLLLAVGNKKLNITSSKADGGLFIFLTQGTVQRFTTDAYFQVIAALSNGGSVRAHASLPEFTANCRNFTGSKRLQREESQEKVISNFQ